jgi:hypothetical protein
MTLSSLLIHFACCAVFSKQKYHYNFSGTDSSKTVSVTISYCLSTWPCKWSDFLCLSFIPSLHENFVSSHLISTQHYTNSRPSLYRRSLDTGCDILFWKFSFIKSAMMPYTEPVWSWYFLYNVRVIPKDHNLQSSVVYQEISRIYCFLGLHIPVIGIGSIHWF